MNALGAAAGLAGCLAAIELFVLGVAALLRLFSKVAH